MKKYHGVIPPIITPLKDDETVDEKSFRKLISHCIDKGLHGIFVAGSMGETMALTQRERDRAIKIAISETAGRVPVLAGVMDTSSKRVIENIKRLEQMGEAVAVVTPVFYAPHSAPNETVMHFEAVARATGAKMMIYNIPPYTGVTLRAETVFKLAKIDGVIGYKDSSGSLPDFMRCLEYFKGTDFVLLQGLMEYSAPAMLMGADGFIPAMAVAYPEPYIGIYEQGRLGNNAETMRYDRINTEICKIWRLTKNPMAATKYTVNKLTGLCDKRCVCPAEPTTPEEEKQIDAKIEEISALIAEMMVPHESALKA